MSKIRVYLVEDYALAMERLNAALDSESDIEVVGKAADAEQAIQDLESCNADVVLMDVELPGMNGVEATRILKERCPTLAVVILTSHQGEYVTEARNAGAVGYLLKLASAQDLIQVVRNAHFISKSQQ